MVEKGVAVTDKQVLVWMGGITVAALVIYLVSQRPKVLAPTNQAAAEDVNATKKVTPEHPGGELDFTKTPDAGFDVLQ